MPSGPPRLVVDNEAPERVDLARQTELLADAIRSQGDLIDAVNKAMIANLLLFAEVIARLPAPDADEPEVGA